MSVVNRVGRIGSPVSRARPPIRPSRIRPFRPPTSPFGATQNIDPTQIGHRYGQLVASKRKRLSTTGELQRIEAHTEPATIDQIIDRTNALVRLPLSDRDKRLALKNAIRTHHGRGIRIIDWYPLPQASFAEAKEIVKRKASRLYKRTRFNLTRTLPPEGAGRYKRRNVYDIQIGDGYETKLFRKIPIGKLFRKLGISWIGHKTQKVLTLTVDMKKELAEKLPQGFFQEVVRGCLLELSELHMLAKSNHLLLHLDISEGEKEDHLEVTPELHVDYNPVLFKGFRNKRFKTKMLRIRNSISLALRGIVKGARTRSWEYAKAGGRSIQQKKQLRQWQQEDTFRRYSPFQRIDSILDAAGNDYIYSDWIKEPSEDQTSDSRIAIVGHRKAQDGVRTLLQDHPELLSGLGDIVIRIKGIDTEVPTRARGINVQSERLNEIREKLRDLESAARKCIKRKPELMAEASRRDSIPIWTDLLEKDLRDKFMVYHKLRTEEDEVEYKINEISELVNRKFGYVVISDVHLAGGAYTPAVDSFYRLGTALGERRPHEDGKIKQTNPKLENLLASMELVREARSTLVLNGDIFSLVDMEEYFKHIYVKEVEKRGNDDFLKQFGMSIQDIKAMKVAEKTDEREPLEAKFRKAIFDLIWAAYPEVEAKLTQLINEEIKVIYIAGNHDADVYFDSRYRLLFEEKFSKKMQFSEEMFLNKIQIRRSLLDESLGLLFYHGHLSDAEVSSRKMERWFIRWAIRLKKRYGPTADFHAEEFWNHMRTGIYFLKRHVIDPVCLIQSLNQWALGEAPSQLDSGSVSEGVEGYTGHELKLVVHGHFHRAQPHWLGYINKAIDNLGVRMIEAGAWVGKNEMLAGSPQQVEAIMDTPGPAKWRYRFLYAFDRIPFVRPIIRRIVATGVLIYLLGSAGRDRKNDFVNWSKKEAIGSSEHVTIIPAVGKPAIVWLRDPNLVDKISDPKLLPEVLDTKFDLPPPGEKSGKKKDK